MIKFMFGVWNNSSLYEIGFKQRRSYKVIIATAVLHNYIKQLCCPDPPMEVPNQAGNDQQELLQSSFHIAALLLDKPVVTEIVCSTFNRLVQCSL